MEKFIVKSQEKRVPVKFKPVQMYEDTHEMVEEVMSYTNETKAQTIHRMIEFAFKHIEIVKEGE